MFAAPPGMVVALMGSAGKNVGWHRNPCDGENTDLFHGLTDVTIGYGNKVSFWELAWLEGLRPKHIVSLIFDISKSKK